MYNNIAKIIMKISSHCYKYSGTIIIIILLCIRKLVKKSTPASIYVVMEQNLINNNIDKNHNDDIIPLL